MFRNIIEHHGSLHSYFDRPRRWYCNAGAILAGFLILVATVSGCQNGPAWDLTLVEGTITQAGKPLAGVRVTFMIDVEASTKGPRASGVTDDAGHYLLRTDGGKSGVAVGQYRVCIDDSRARMPSSGKRGPDKRIILDDPASKVKSRVSDIYANALKTPFRAEVRHGTTQTFDFDIPK